MNSLPSGLSEHVGDSEDLCRFLTSSGDFLANRGIVKPRVFLPNPKNLETSVFRHGAEPASGLWEIASNEIPPERSVHGAGIVKAGVVRKVALEVIADETPPNGPRHANIIGWPLDSNDPEEQKSRWKDLANAVSKEANLVLR
jgi:hypothetical protein